MDSRGRRTVKKIIARRDGAACVWCGMTLAPESADASLDHVITQREGGSWWAGNLLLACRDCNTARLHAPLEQWTLRCQAQGLTSNLRALTAAAQRAAHPLALRVHHKAFLLAATEELQAAARQRKAERRAAHQARQAASQQSQRARRLAMV